MAALFLAYVAPQTGCILALWIVLCVYVESPIGRYPTPSSFFAASPSSFCFLHLLAALLFPTLEPPFFFIFPTPFSLLSLEHPAAIDRQKKPRGYLIIAHHEGTPLALFHGFTKVQHFSTLPAGESLKYLEVIPWTCATFANPRAFCLFLFPPSRSRSILPSPTLPGVANKRYKSAFTISNAAAFIIAITTPWPSCAPLLPLCRSHLQTVTS